jgi:hypothetical protein
MLSTTNFDPRASSSSPDIVCVAPPSVDSVLVRELDCCCCFVIAETDLDVARGLVPGRTWTLSVVALRADVLGLADVVPGRRP